MPTSLIGSSIRAPRYQSGSTSQALGRYKDIATERPPSAEGPVEPRASPRARRSRPADGRRRRKVRLAPLLWRPLRPWRRHRNEPPSLSGCRRLATEMSRRSPPSGCRSHRRSGVQFLLFCHGVATSSRRNQMRGAETLRPSAVASSSHTCASPYRFARPWRRLHESRSRNFCMTGGPSAGDPCLVERHGMDKEENHVYSAVRRGARRERSIDD
jgi:hypothetical protein